MTNWGLSSPLLKLSGTPSGQNPNLMPRLDRRPYGRVFTQSTPAFGRNAQKAAIPPGLSEQAKSTLSGRLPNQVGATASSA